MKKTYKNELIIDFDENELQNIYKKWDKFKIKEFKNEDEKIKFYILAETYQIKKLWDIIELLRFPDQEYTLFLKKIQYIKS
jgi:hypothetical protein